MNPEKLKDRTKQFALRVPKLVAALPKTIEDRAIASQLIHCRTSIAANYRTTYHTKSKTEFIAKVGTVLEEADEALLWLELIAEANLLPQKRVEPLLSEANELVAIMVASRRSAASNLKSAI